MVMTGNRREFLRTAGAALAAGLAAPQLMANDLSSDAGTQSAALSGSVDGSHATEAKIRGVMVDAARVPESLAYYRRVIEFCSDWELNTLQFRLADDQGTALRFASVADLVTHRNAFTHDELAELAEYGRSHGVDLIPELESFGHTGYITRSSAYAYLLDEESNGSKEFTGMIPVHPDTIVLFEKLYREVSARRLR
jgi:N-acetyl-beta-hexosaminidase